MADDTEIKVTITADSSQVASATQQATVSAKTFADALKAAGGDLKKVNADMLGLAGASKSVAQEAVAAASAVQQQGAAMRAGAAAAREVAEAHGRVRLATAGATREIIVLAHEMVTGRFTRVPGSLMVLAERMGGLHTMMESLTPATLGWGAAILAAAGALVGGAIAVERWNEALGGIQVAMEASGRGADFSRDKINALILDLRQIPGVTTSTAQEMVTLFGRQRDIGVDAYQKLGEAAAGYARASGIEIKKAAEDLARAFDGTYASLVKLDYRLHFLSIAQREAMADAARHGDQTRMEQIAVDALNAKYKALATEGLTDTRRAINEVRLAFDRVFGGILNLFTGATRAANDFKDAVSPLTGIPMPRPVGGAGGFAGAMAIGPPKSTTIPAGQQSVFQSAAAAHGVPLGVLAWVGANESGFNPTQGANAFGATGEMQFKPATFASVLPTGDIAKWQDQVQAAAIYLKQLFDKFGTWEEAVAHYGTFRTGLGSAADAAKRAQFQDAMARQAAAATPATKPESTAPAGAAGDVDKIREAQEAADRLGASDQRLIELQQAYQQAIQGADAAHRQAIAAANKGNLQEAADYETTQQQLVKDAANIQNQITAWHARGAETRMQQWHEELQQKLASDGNFLKDSTAEQVAYWQQRLAEVNKGSREEALIEQQLFSLKREMARSDLDNQIEALRAKQAANRDRYTVVATIENQILALKAAAYGQDDRRYQEELRHQEELARQHAEELRRIAEKQIDDQVSADGRALRSRIQTLNYERDMGQLTAGQAAQAQVKAIQDITAAELQLLQTRLAIDAQNEKAAAATADRIKQIQEQAAEETTRILQQDAVRIRNEWEQDFRGIESAVSGVFSDMMSGSNTLGQALGHAAERIADSFINNSMKMLGKWVADRLAETTITTAQQTAQTAAVGAGATARTAITAGAAAAGKAAEMASTTATIGGDAAKAAAGVYASVSSIPYIGWLLAPAAAAAAFAAVMAFGGSIPSAAGGWDMVPADGTIAELHRNEMVLPASIATPLRAALGGVGAATPAAHFNVNYAPALTHAGTGAMSAREAQAFFETHKNSLVSVMQRAHRDGSFKIPRY